MLAGNARYESTEDLPDIIPVFPLKAVILLPRGQLPLNIFEERYLEMIDHALRTDKVIGMIQPRFDKGEPDMSGNPPICDVGCAGRLTAYQETGDGRVLVTLTGIARFKVREELDEGTDFRQCRINASPFDVDFIVGHEEGDVNRKSLLKTFRAYLDANSLEADWKSVEKASNEVLVNALSMMSPYGPAEKQALLEAPDLKARADTLIAITEIELARSGGEGGSTLQ